MFAAIVFSVASVTDFVDGYLARSRNSVTTFGKLMDPLADKLLIVAALISLVSLHRLAAWVAMVIIARELAVTVLRMGASQAGVIMPASDFGKVEDLRADRRGARRDRGPQQPPPRVARRAALRRRRGHGRVGPGLLLRAAAARSSGARSGSAAH